MWKWPDSGLDGTSLVETSKHSDVKWIFQQDFGSGEWKLKALEPENQNPRFWSFQLFVDPLLFPLLGSWSHFLTWAMKKPWLVRLGYTGDCTTQLYREYNKPWEGSLLNKKYDGIFGWKTPHCSHCVLLLFPPLGSWSHFVPPTWYQ